MTLRELVIRNIDGKNVNVPLDRDRITLGRSSANELCYPDDAGLSRQHLALTRSGDSWQVEDLGSKNGTVLNGKRIDKPTSFKEGDRISAGHLTIEFAEGAHATANTVVFVEQNEAFSNTSTTVVASLDAVLGPQTDDLNKTYVMQGSPQMRALIRKVVSRRIAAGDTHLQLVEGTDLLGPSRVDGLVDGTHPNDLGFQWMAEGLAERLRKVLGL